MTTVALFTRAWIEMASNTSYVKVQFVALFTRAWIEIPIPSLYRRLNAVALFTRAWIEIKHLAICKHRLPCRPLHEGVD